MRILVDADACPVKDEIRTVAREFGVGVLFFAAVTQAPNEALSGEAAHEWTLVEPEKEAVDFAILNRLAAGDIVVTQDFGLAAIAMQKGAAAIGPTGRMYDIEKAEALLEARHHAQKMRRSKRGVSKLPKKRPFTDAGRRRFAEALRILIQNLTINRE